MKALFLGTLEVDKPCGIDVLHGAIDHMVDNVPRAEWKNSTVAVAPSTVTISYSDPSSSSSSSSSSKKGRSGQHHHQLDCRVRFLSFLGIGQDTRQAAFIMHTAQDTFVAHVFHCEPSAGPLCKTIEAACKLRYQKCLDARPQRGQQQHQQQEGGSPSAAAVVSPGGTVSAAGAADGRSSIGASIKSMLARGRSRLMSPPLSSRAGPPPS